jgi:hypothetical protein
MYVSYLVIHSFKETFHAQPSSEPMLYLSNEELGLTCYWLTCFPIVLIAYKFRLNVLIAYKFWLY